MTRKSPPPAASAGNDPDPEQKDRVIHTRVPESLEAELRKRAGDLGMSVSNLVRNVLGHAFGLVGDVAADAHAVARAAKGERVAPATIESPGFAGARSAAERRGVSIDDVLAWQSIVLGKNAVCAQCNELLPKGHDAAIGVAEHGGGRVIVCATCFEELRA